MNKQFDFDGLMALEQRYRAAFINSLGGFKSVVLLGTKNNDGQTNLAIFNSLFHIGANPPLCGLIVRPDSVERHTFENIMQTGFYTVNHIKPEFYENAHQTSARYPREVSEFDTTQLSAEYKNNLDTSTGSIEFTHFSPKVGITYEIKQDVGLYTNFAQGFSPPALSAIFLKRTTPAANGDKYYFNLEPATFVNYEIGGWAAFAHNKIYLDLAIYRLNGTNELLNIRQPDNSFDFQSVGRTEHKGIEWSVTYKPTPELFFRFGGTYAIHKFIDFVLSTKAADSIKNVNGNEMPSAPHFVWNTEFSYYPKFVKDLRMSIEWQHVAGWYQNQINTVSYEGYDLFNARFGYKFHGFEIFTNILNLTNSLYATQATRGNNPTDRSSYYASAPRTYVIGLQYSF